MANTATSCSRRVSPVPVCARQFAEQRVDAVDQSSQATVHRARPGRLCLAQRVIVVARPTSPGEQLRPCQAEVRQPDRGPDRRGGVRE